MTHDREASSTEYHERQEVQILADTILAGLELADALEVHDLQPVMQRSSLTIPTSLLSKDFEASILPQIIYEAAGADDTHLQLTYESSSAGTRPSLELQLLREDATDTFVPFAVLHSPGGDIPSAVFHGSAASADDREDPKFEVDPEDIALLLEKIVKPEGIVINDQGVAVLELLRELVHDPQYPPTARFITDVLEQQGAEATKDLTYMLTIDGTDFILRSTIEDGKTSEVIIIEVMQDTLEAFGEDIRRFYKAIGARIARTEFSQAITFFHADDQGNEQPFKADAGDLHRLREMLDYVRRYVTTEAQL